MLKKLKLNREEISLSEQRLTEGSETLTTDEKMKVKARVVELEKNQAAMTLEIASLKQKQKG